MMSIRVLIQRLFLLLTVFQILSCTAPAAKIYSDSNPNIDIRTASTFAWLKDDYLLESSKESNPIIAAKVARAIEAEMKRRGYKQVEDPEEADLTISFTVGSREEIDIRSFPVTYGAGFGWGGPYYGRRGAVFVGTETRAITYDEGKLAIDIFDVASKQPVWHGVATKQITSSDRENSDALIKETVKRILAEFKAETTDEAIN